MIASAKLRRILVLIAIGLVAAALVDLCGLEGSEEPRTGDEVRAVRPSPTPVSVPVTLDELVRGSVATDARVEGDAGDTTPGGNSAPSTAPHQITVLPGDPEVSNPVEIDTGLTEDDLLALLASSPWPRHEWPNVVSVAHCESRFDPSETGDGGLAHGLMQVREDYWPRLVRSFDLYDAREALTAGYIAYLEWRLTYGVSGWGAWSCKP